MGRAVLVLALVMYGASLSSTWAQQGAWCEANCKTLCTKIWECWSRELIRADLPGSNNIGKSCAPLPS